MSMCLLYNMWYVVMHRAVQLTLLESVIAILCTLADEHTPTLTIIALYIHTVVIL